MSRIGGFCTGAGFQRRRVGEQAGKAEDAGELPLPLRADVQRHHRALAEADQRAGAFVEVVALKLGVEKGVERRARPRDAARELARVAHRQRKPLPPHRRAWAKLGRIRRDEGGGGEGARPIPPDADQIVAVGAVAVQEHDQAFGLGAAGAGAMRGPSSID